MASNQGGGAPPSGAAALNQQLLQQATALAAAMQNAAAQANNPAGIPALPAIPPAAAVMLNDIAVLSQISQVPENDLRNNPQTLALVQATVLRSIMQQQGLAAPRFPAAAVMPGQLLQQPAAAQPQTRATRGGRASAGAKGKANKASSAPAVAPKPQPKKQSVPKVDPGGKVIWAKVGNNPWWPAKTLQEGKDISFPRNEEPPRPTSIAIRFFGNHEFAWLGSKRQIMDWEDGAENRSQVTQDNFTLAIQEAETYLKSKQLPEIFFQVPATEAAASKRGGKRRVSTKKGTSVVEDAAAAGIAPTVAKPRATAVNDAVNRAHIVKDRKMQWLLDNALVPPKNSPFATGKIAANSELLQFADAWRQQHPEVMKTAETAAAAETRKRPRI